MNKIIVVDLIMFFIFCLVITFFLYKRRNNLKREGIIFLYKTKIGIKAMERFASKNKNFLNRLSPIIIFFSIILMISVIFIFLLNAFFYVYEPEKTIESTKGAPPIVPVIPYFPQLFGMKSFFPNFYFVYFIIAFSIVAIFHEMAHGLYMVLYKVKIKSTGFLFLGPILGAFVEQDDKEFRKKTNKQQMTTLGAGVFANLLLSLIFGIILLSFFFSFYSPQGYLITNYATTQINFSEIKNHSFIENNLTLLETYEGKKYLIPKESFILIKDNISLSEESVLSVYYYSPAILNKISGYITEIDGKKVKNSEDIINALREKKPGEKIKLKTEINKTERSFEVVLEQNPFNYSLAFLGIPLITKEILIKNIQNQNFNPIRKIFTRFFLIKDPLLLYKPKINSEVADYIYYLIWWIMIINLFVSLFNMLPFGIFDGGRFSYLLILSLTKSKEKTERIHKVLRGIIILSFFLLIFSWVFAKILF